MKTDLIYGIDDRPPLKETLFAAIQHLLAIFVAIITPLVSGILLLLIGLSLIKVGVVACGGGYSAMDNGTFGSPQYIGVAGSVLLGVSLALGLGVELMPEILSSAPQSIKGIFSSGITTGGLTAILANLFIRVKED